MSNETIAEKFARLGEEIAEHYPLCECELCRRVVELGDLIREQVAEQCGDTWPNS
jgi:hypothetical protein